MYHMLCVMFHVSRVKYHVSYVTSVWLPSLLPLNWASSKTFFVQHLQLCVPIPLSGVREHLVEIWGLSEVRFRFWSRRRWRNPYPKSTKKCRNFWTNNQILISFEIWSLQNILKVVYFITQSPISNTGWDIVQLRLLLGSEDLQTHVM